MKMYKGLLALSLLLSVCLVVIADENEKKRDFTETIVEKIRERSENNLAEQMDIFQVASEVQKLFVPGILLNAAVKAGVPNFENNVFEQAEKGLAYIKTTEAYANFCKTGAAIVDYCVEKGIAQALAIDELASKIDKLDGFDKLVILKRLMRDSNFSAREADKKILSYTKGVFNNVFDLSEVLIDLHHDCIDQYGESFCNKVDVVIFGTFSEKAYEYMSKKIDQRIVTLQDILAAQKQAKGDS